MKQHKYLRQWLTLTDEWEGEYNDYKFTNEICERPHIKEEFRQN